MRLREKVAIVTGARSGIGLATAQWLGRDGASVIANSVPVSEFRSRWPVRSATLKRTISSNGRDPTMPRRARPTSEPDLFSIETVPRTPAPPATSPAPMPSAESLDISPEDFRRIIVRWSDDEIRRLRDIVATETHRRGLIPPEQDAKGDASAGRSRQQRPELLAKGLAPGKVNAIRAASQAGVKLSKIAQEFGLPLAAVKRVIAASTAS
jgi:hypothetical protein